MGVLRLADGGDDLRARGDLAGAEGHQHRGVVAVRGDDHRRRVLHAGESEHIGLRRRTLNRHEALPGGGLENHRIGVDHDDLGRGDPVAEHGVDRGTALGAVTDDDGVITHAAPPTLDLECLTGTLGQCRQSGTDQHDEEEHPERRDQQDVDQARFGGEGGDIAVAGGRERDRGVVDAVQQGQFVVLGVDVPVPIEVDDDDREEQRRERIADATGDRESGTGLLLGYAQHTDEREVGALGELIGAAEPRTQPPGHRGVPPSCCRSPLAATLGRRGTERTAPDTGSQRTAAR